MPLQVCILISPIHIPLNVEPSLYSDYKLYQPLLPCQHILYFPHGVQINNVTLLVTLIASHIGISCFKQLCDHYMHWTPKTRDIMSLEIQHRTAETYVPI